MKTKFETKSEYETAIASALGHDACPKYRAATIIMTKALDVILAMIEDAASSISGAIDLDGEDAAKLQHIEEAAWKATANWLTRSWPSSKSDSFAEDPVLRFAQDVPNNLMEDDDAAD